MSVALWLRYRSMVRNLMAVMVGGSVSVLAIGCGSDGGTNPPRSRVNGTITLDGQPAPAGTIVFVPLKPGQLQAQGLVGDDGKFTIDEAGGPSPGEYKVEIRCAKKTGRRVPSLSSSDGSGMIDERVPVTPAKYNTASDLRQTINTGDNNLEFHLKTGK